MIENISVKQYKKLKELNFTFNNGLNIISGTNGTCKTSLLHIMSNSFQNVTKTNNWIKKPECLDVINKINNAINPKIEGLTKGDKKHNDPANGYKGTLFDVKYTIDKKLSFRKHNSPKNSRYAVKPYYAKGSHESLPYCPVIYLGLARLFPYGEFKDDSEIAKLKKELPSEYKKDVDKLYEKFTHIKIVDSAPQKLGNIKVRSDFNSDKDGIDSNTISAGEDNLYMILTSLVSLKYYFESIDNLNVIESILLIDELDATLHPSYQIKLWELFRDYSKDYKVQIVITTHSISLLEHALKKKDNVIYLIDNVTDVILMEAPDIYKIKRFLHNVTVDDIYLGKKIPIFTEDAEARIFLNMLFDYFAEVDSEFAGVLRYFHIVDANIGADNLNSIFNDEYLLKSTMQSICILDGDQENKKNYDKNTMVLPGKVSPEKLIMEYSIKLCEEDDAFWRDSTILELNYGKLNFLDQRKPDIENISCKLEELKQAGESTHGVERELRKKCFAKHERFFTLLFKHWIRNSENKVQVDKFLKDLHIMFKRVAEFHGINSKDWDFN